MTIGLQAYLQGYMHEKTAEGDGDPQQHYWNTFERAADKAKRDYEEGEPDEDIQRYLEEKRQYDLARREEANNNKHTNALGTSHNPEGTWPRRLAEGAYSAASALGNPARLVAKAFGHDPKLDSSRGYAGTRQDKALSEKIKNKHIRLRGVDGRIGDPVGWPSWRTTPADKKGLRWWRDFNESYKKQNETE